MRSLLTIMLLAAAALPALGQAQTVNICDRTQAVRFAIMRQAGSDDCAAVSAAQMDGIEKLDLDGRGIHALKTGDFDGLAGLERLRLHNNQLAELPAGVFSGLPGVWSLSLRDNQLTSLPPGVFDGMSKATCKFLDCRATC